MVTGKHTLVALVQDNPGVLNRMVSLFRRRGFNIASIAVGSSELPGVKKVMVELHPELIGEAGVRSFLGWLSDLGFRKDGDISKDVEIYLERR